MHVGYPIPVHGFSLLIHTNHLLNPLATTNFHTGAKG